MLRSELLVTGDWAGPVRRYDLRDGSVEAVPVKLREVHSLDLSADGRRLLVAGTGVVRWDLQAGEGVEIDPFARLASFCGAHVVAARNDVAVWLDDDAGPPLRRFAPHTRPIHALACTAREVITGGEDQRVVVSALADGAPIAELTGHRAPVVAVAVSPDGARVASGDRLGELRIWTLPGGKLRGAHRPAVGGISALAFRAAGELLIGGAEGAIVRWDVDRARIEATLSDPAPRTHDNRAHALATRGTEALHAGPGPAVIRWDVTGARCLRAATGHRADVTAVAFAGKHAVTGSDDATLRVWALPELRPGAQLAGHRDRIYGVAASPDGKLAASVGEDGQLGLWSLPGGRRLSLARAHGFRANSVAFTPSGKAVLTTGDDNRAKLWMLGARKETWSVRTYADGLSVAVSPDGKHHAAGDQGERVKVLDGAGALRFDLQGHARNVSSLAFAADGTLYSADQGGGLRAWDPARGELLRTFEPYPAGLDAIGLADTDRLVVAAAEDGQLVVWSAPTGQIVYMARADASCRHVAWTPDGRYRGDAGLVRLVLGTRAVPLPPDRHLSDAELARRLHP